MNGDFSKLYGINRDDATYIHDAFLVFKARDKKHSRDLYRTQTAILEIYDTVTESTRTGQPYQTRLDPPPADPRCCHPPREAERTER